MTQDKLRARCKTCNVWEEYDCQVSSDGTCAYDRHPELQVKVYSQEWYAQHDVKLIQKIS